MSDWWATARRRILTAAIGIAVLAAAIGVLELWHLYSLGARVHWILGATLVAVALALATGLVLAPTLKFLRLPVAARPPEMPAVAVPADLRRRVAYLQARFGPVAGLPELRARCVDSADAASLAAEIRAFESRELEPRLAEADAEADRIIREEALNVGFATAVSGNGALDAFVVFWRSVVLVSRIATLYYGRPGLRGTLLIVKDVALAIAAARVAQTATDWLGKLLPRVIPGFAGFLLPPVVNGGFNLIMTMKVGHLAKRRCRSFEAWTEAEREKSVVEVLAFVASQSLMLVTEFVARLGGFLTKGVVAAAGAGVNAVGSAARSIWETVAGWFGARGSPAPA